MAGRDERAPGLWGLTAFLRAFGYECSVEEFATALRALDAMEDVTDWRHAETLLRPILARDLRAWEAFPALFAAFLRGEVPATVPGEGVDSGAPKGRGRPDAVPAAGAVRPAASEEGSEGAASSGREVGGAHDVEVSPEEADREERASATGTGRRPGKAEAPQTRLGAYVRRYHALTLPPAGRRFGPARRGTRVDLGRTLAESRRTGGEPLRLAWLAPRPPRPHRVLLIDTSTSMDAQEGFLERFAAVMGRPPVRAEVYGFSTHLVAWRRHSREGGALWQGGTRIGESLLAYLHGAGRHLTRHSHVCIVSDGWETGDIAYLKQALAGLVRRAARVDWLCPLAGSAGFTPACRGLQAALEAGVWVYDVHDVESFGRYLDLFGSLREGEPRPVGPGVWRPASATDLRARHPLSFAM